MGKVKITFNGYQTLIDENELEQGIVDVNFGGSAIFQFQKMTAGWMCINGMNGHGQNIKDEVYGKYANISRNLDTHTLKTKPMQEEFKQQHNDHYDSYYNYFIEEVNKRKEQLQKDNPDKDVKLNFTPLQEQLGWTLDFVLMPKKQQYPMQEDLKI